MKKRNRLLALLLAFTVVLTFMPMMVFAEDAASDESQQPVAAEVTEEAAEAVEEPAAEAVEEAVEEAAEPAAEPKLLKAASVKPVSATFNFDATPLVGYVGDSVILDNDFRQVGNSFTVKFSDGSVKDYVFVSDDEADAWGFYLDGNTSNPETTVGYVISGGGRLQAGENEATVWMEYGGTEYDIGTITVNAVDNEEIVSVVYEQAKPITAVNSSGWVEYYGDWEMGEYYLPFAGDKLTVSKYDFAYDEDGNLAGKDGPYLYVFECRLTEDPENGNAYNFVLTETDDSDRTEFIGENIDVLFTMDIWDDQTGNNSWKPGTTHELIVSVNGVEASPCPKVNVVSENGKVVPNHVEVTPAEPLWGFVGDDQIENWYEEGNRFLVTFSDGSQKTFIAAYDEDEDYVGFFENGDTSKPDNYYFGYSVGNREEGENYRLVEGSNTVKLEMHDYTDGEIYLDLGTIEITGKKTEDIVSAVYTQKKPIEAQYSQGWAEWDPYTDKRTLAGDKITVVKYVYEEEYDEDGEFIGTTRHGPYEFTYECKKDSYGDYEFVRKDEYGDDDWLNVRFWDDQVWDPQEQSGNWLPGETHYLEATIEGKTVDGDIVVKVVDKPHAHNKTTLKKIKKVAATCQTYGVKEHYECQICGEWFKDVKGKKKTTEAAMAIKPVAHKYKNKKVVTEDYLKSEATCTKKAVYYYCAECKMCHETKKAKKTFTTGKALGHDYVKGDITKATAKKDGKIAEKCTRCGKKTKGIKIPKVSKVVVLNKKSVKYVGEGGEKELINLVFKKTKFPLEEGEYTVEYSEPAYGKKGKGSGTVTVTFTSECKYYSGTLTLKYTITKVPKNL